jgi:hypothetical protein
MNLTTFSVTFLACISLELIGVMTLALSKRTSQKRNGELWFLISLLTALAFIAALIMREEYFEATQPLLAYGATRLLTYLISKAVL